MSLGDTAGPPRTTRAARAVQRRVPLPSYFSSQKWAFGSACQRIPVRWLGRFAFFRSFSTFRRLKNQNSSDIDQIVGNHAKIVSLFETATQIIRKGKSAKPTARDLRDVEEAWVYSAGSFEEKSGLRFSGGVLRRCVPRPMWDCS